MTRRRVTGAFALARLPDGREFWCAWRDHAGALRGNLPDGTGWCDPVDPLVAGLATVGAALAAFFGRRDVSEPMRDAALMSPGELAARAFLGRRPVVRRDTLAAPWVTNPPPRHVDTPPAGREPPWWSGELGVEWPATLDACKRAYRARAMQAHPDRQGGDERAARQLNRAWEEAQKHFAGGTE